MKTAIVLCTVLGCFHGLANACTILNKRQVRIGVEQGIEGNCANNGERIACTLSQDEGASTAWAPAGVITAPTWATWCFLPVAATANSLSSGDWNSSWKIIPETRKTSSISPSIGHSLRR